MPELAESTSATGCYRLVKRVLYFFLRPIYLAESEEALLRAGYILFGFQLFGTLLLLKFSDPFGAWTWISKSIPHLFGIVLWLLNKQQPLIWNSPLIDVSLLYIFAWFAFPIRRFFGRLGLQSAFWAIGFLVTLGERLLQRRTLALLCTIGLLVLFTLGLTSLYFSYKRNSESRGAYDVWLAEAEQFISRATLVSQERSLYEPVNQAWGTVIQRELTLDNEHPARLLHEALERLYSTPLVDPELWVVALRKEIRNVSQLVVLERALRDVPAGREREWSLVFAFLGRGYLRSVGDSCSPIIQLRRGYTYYDAVISPALLPSQQNGLGTVLACRLVHFLEAHEAGSDNVSPGWDPPPCLSARHCLEEAEANYIAAAGGTEECGFMDKRLRNNTLDLYLKLGLHFDTARSVLGAPPFGEQLATRATFAEAVKGKLRSLLQCWDGEFVPAILLSSAQAYGIVAQVSSEASDARRAALDNAARYLRFSIAWLPGATLESDFKYYCSAVTEDGDINEDFWRAYQAALPGLPEGLSNQVWTRIKLDCGES